MRAGAVSAVTWLAGASGYDYSIAFARQATMIEAHHLNNARPRRGLWTLEVPGPPYRVLRGERYRAVARSSRGAGARAESG